MANIYFKTIKLNNFMSYQYEEIILDRNGFVLVNGKNLNPLDNSKSNGCGKSTMFNAIAWVMTGETTSGVKDVSNVYTDGNTIVEINFDIDKTSYKLIRSKNPSNLKIFINEEDKSGKGIRDTEKLLSEYLPEINNSLLNSVIILGQGLPQKFTNNTPSGRKEVLEKLSKSDFMINDLKTRISTRSKELNRELRLAEDELLVLKNTIEVLNSEVDNINNNIENINKEDKNKLKSDISKIEIDSKKIKNEIKDIINQKSKLQNEYDSYKKLQSELLELKHKQKSDLSKDENIVTNLYSAKSKLNQKKSEIKALENIKDRCPTCGQKLKNVEMPDITPVYKELEKLEHEVFELERAKENNENDYKLSLESIDKKYEDKLNSIENDINVVNISIEQLGEHYTNKLNSYNDYEKEHVKLSERLKNIESNKSNLEKELNSKLQKIEKCDFDIINKNNIVNTVEGKIEVNNKMASIIKREFRGYLLINVIEFIQKRCKFYADEVFNNDNLEFKLDGNNISIKYDNKEYEMLSGGEKQKIDVILQLSIRDMLCSYLNFSSNILVLDEITDSLDIVGANSIFNLISKQLTDVQAIYIISHHTDFDIPVDDEIRIIKGEDKISRIE